MAPASQQAQVTGSRTTTKVRLDPATIIAAALEVSAASGSTQLSAKALGAHLGVDPSAVYRHFRNKSELMEALLDELNMRSMRAVTAPPKDWRERLRQLAQQTLVEYCTHPAVAAEAMVLTTHGPGENAAIELMLDAFAEAGLEPDEIVRHYALMSSHVLSSASGIARARAGRPFDATEFSPWLDGPIVSDPRTSPRITELSPQLAKLDDREIFKLGIESVILSAERSVAAR